MVRERCSATRANGQPCQAFVLPDETLCFSHHPDKANEVKAAQRRGGENRSAQRRAARLWADQGRQVRDEDLVPILKAAILDVRSGVLEPSMATAISGLAKVAMQLKADAELDARLSRLEERAGIVQPTPIRRLK